MRQSRAPALYARMGAPDTVEGRFEVLTLHVILLIDALRDRNDNVRASSQALFDAYVGDLDGALREMGVGDLTVGRRMRALGGAFYGRAAAYREAFGALPDRKALEALIVRTVMAGRGQSAQLTDYVVRCRDLLLSAETTTLLESGPAWPRI